MFVADTVFLVEMGLPGFWFFCSLDLLMDPLAWYSGENVWKW
jgi:hypothetical protein